MVKHIQIIRRLLLSVFDHFVGLALKVLSMYDFLGETARE